jgi:FkbM family methyltransferase
MAAQNNSVLSVMRDYNGVRVGTTESFNNGDAVLGISSLHLLSKVKNATCLDIGAAQGWWTVLAAKLGMKVWSFEPNPENLTHLNNTISRESIGGSVTVVPCAASNAEGRRSFSLSGEQSCVVDGGRAVCDSSAAVTTVSTCTIDSMFPAPAQVAYMKVDVEGHEPEVFAGAEQLLRDRRCSYIHTEFTVFQYGLEAGNRLLQSLLQHMPCAYACCRCDGVYLVGPIAPEQTDDFCADHMARHLQTDILFSLVPLSETDVGMPIFPWKRNTYMA